MNLSYTITNSAITALVDGEVKCVRSTAPQYAIIRKLLDDGQHGLAIDALRDPMSVIQAPAGSALRIEAGRVYFRDEEVQGAGIADRLLKMRANAEDTTGMEHFLRRLATNPSWRSTQQLFQFLVHCGIPVDKDGTFLIYKGVKEDFKDCHTGKIDNSIGTVHEMARNLISDDPDVACHFGFHVGALEYAKDFGPNVIVCRVAPEDVVCVPRDCSVQKMRVCKYTVIGHWSGEAMTDTNVTDDERVDEETDSYEEYEDATDHQDDDGHEVEPKNFYLNERHELPNERMGHTARELLRGKKHRLPAMKGMNSRQLLEQSLDDLRAYAKKLKIVGATKIRGGKVALIAKITKVRAKGNRK